VPKSFVRGETLKYYATFIENSCKCFELIVVTLNESYQWLIQSFEESKSVTCSLRGFADSYGLSYLNDLVKAFIGVSNASRTQLAPKSLL
jgi:hypothetical protein